MMLPVWIRIFVKNNDKVKVNLWLPLFLIWILLLPLAVVVFFVALIVDILFWAAMHGRATKFLIALVQLLGAIRGTVIQVDKNSHRERIELFIY